VIIPRLKIVLFVAVIVFTVVACRRASEPETSKAEPTTAPVPAQTTALRVVTGHPISGAGKVLSTSAIFHDDAGQLNITDLFLVINDSTHGVDGTGGCAIWEKRPTGEVYLLDDSGKKWLGPHKAGSSNVLVNSQCLISVQNTGLAEVNQDLQWVTAVAFDKNFSGPKNIYAKAINKQKKESSFALVGSWTASPQ
jgi:hypothetical protein